MTIQVPQKRIRFAIYTRYSSEMQNELSLEAQEQSCREAIAKRKGVVIDVYSDSAKSGWSLERNGFNELRRNAEKKKFDAIMFWKFDRLARNHDHAIMIKILLRSEYNLKLYCVEGFSEDENNSPQTAIMEQMLTVFSAFYSKNLSNETKRGKRQRAINGEYNGSKTPFGYDLVLKKHASEENPAGLYINPEQAEIVNQIFRMYQTGQHSDQTIAQWMNQQPLIQELRAGKKPFGKGTVRDILRNQLYTGRVSYAETLYKGSLGEHRKGSRHRRQWFEGKHEGIISDELYERCQEVRKSLTRVRRPPTTVRIYVLHDRVFCARCIVRKPIDLKDNNYGKMRPNWSSSRDMGYYRCIAHNRGYHKCEQKATQIDFVDTQVVRALSTLVIPLGFKERVENAVRNRVENAEALERMQKIKEAVERIDFSWEQGFFTPQQYVAKRRELEAEIASLRPVDYEDLMEAADLLENFRTYWDKCENVDTPDEARKQLLAKIVDKVFVYDKTVIGVALHGDFGVVLDDVTTVPSEIIQSLKTKMDTTFSGEKDCVQCENDGI